MEVVRIMSIHSKTPTLAVRDPRAMAILTVNYWRNKALVPSESRIERTLLDARGRAVKQWDARLWGRLAQTLDTPTSLTVVYSLTDSVLRSDSNDAGTFVELPGPGGEILFGWDSRGTCRKVEYDDLLRPVAVFEEGVDEPKNCVERMSYGRPGDGDPRCNQLGQLTRHDDPAGSVLFDSFALTGECIENTRYFTLDAVSPDWPLSAQERQRLLEPGDGATSQWRFAALGQMLEQVDARGNRQTFGLTVDGRLREAHLQLKHQLAAQPMVSQIRYNAAGQVEQELAGNGVRTTLKYQPRNGRLATRRATTASDKLLQQLSYGYDPMGNVLSITDEALPIRYFANQRIEPISAFSYDSLYQLSEASGWEAGATSKGPASVGRIDPAAFSHYRQTYHYDDGGNLLELTHDGAQAHGRRFKPLPHSNRGLPWRNDVPPTEEQIATAFDARGNLLQLDQGRLVRWNLRNQLQSISPVERAGGDNDQETYLYDGGGQRVRKIRSLQTHARTVITEVRYLPGLELRIDGSGAGLQVIAAQTGLNDVNVLHWETSPPPGGNDRYRYTFTDHLGSASLELAEDARIISQESYYPFGETAWSRETEVSYRTIRYSGKERDATGLYYYGYRYYVPWLQRWMNPDPAGTVDGLNLYRMVRNNPMVFTDPDGLDPKGKGKVAAMAAMFSSNSGTSVPAPSNSGTSVPAPVRPRISPRPATLPAVPPGVPTLPPKISQPVQSPSAPVPAPSVAGPTNALAPYASGFIAVGTHQLLVGKNKGVLVLRGDDRTPDQIRAAGGFFPRDNRGLQIKEEFRHAAVTKGINTLAVEHVRSPVPGYVSTGIDENSGGYSDTRNYLFLMEIPGLEEREVSQQTLGVTARPKPIPNGRIGTRVLMSGDTLDQSDFVAMIPPMTVEMTFITPIPSRDIVAFRTRGRHQWQSFH